MGSEALLSRSMVFYINTWSAVYFFPQNLPDEAILDYRPEPAAPFVSQKSKMFNDTKCTYRQDLARRIAR